MTGALLKILVKCTIKLRSNVAIKLDDPVWLNKENKIVQCKEEAFGRQTPYYITHPEYLVFIDEVGDNTSQKNDGNAGGEKFIVDKDKHAIKNHRTKIVTLPCLGLPFQLASPCAVQLLTALKLKMKMWQSEWEYNLGVR